MIVVIVVGGVGVGVAVVVLWLLLMVLWFVPNDDVVQYWGTKMVTDGAKVLV